MWGGREPPARENEPPPRPIWVGRRGKRTPGSAAPSRTDASARSAHPAAHARAPHHHHHHPAARAGAPNERGPDADDVAYVGGGGARRPDRPTCVGRPSRRPAGPVRTGFGMDTGNDPSAGSPTETLLRLLLPLNNKVWTASRSVASGEPNASPQSGGLTGSFNR